jgi:amidohydrolase
MSKSKMRGWVRQSLVLLFSIILLYTAAFADEREILRAIDGANQSLRQVSMKIFDFKELSGEEVKSSQLLKEELQRLGFKVAGDLKVPGDLVKGGIANTAFRAEMQGKSPGPTVTIMLEYDALPNGHSCGHNLIAASGLAAATGLAAAMKNSPGRLLIIGTPAEEIGSSGRGKVALLEGGHFAGSDVVLITHGSDRWNADGKCLAMKRATFVFKGKAAHAASAPHKGVSALDALLLTFQAVDMLREHVRQDVRIHGVIAKGGDRYNIVPDFAQGEFGVRALDTATMEDAYKKVVNCARAGELATGAKLEFKEPRVALKAPIAVPSFAKMVMDQARALGVPEDDIKPSTDFGSSDLGNVAYDYPTINLNFRIAREGTAGHSDALREAAASDEGWKATVITGKTLALVAYKLLNQPEKVQEIKEQFKVLKAKEGL